jgi:hypothetical protein
VLSGDIHTGVASQVGLVFTFEILAPGVDVTTISFLIGLDIIIFTIL